MPGVAVQMCGRASFRDRVAGNQLNKIAGLGEGALAHTLPVIAVVLPTLRFHHQRSRFSPTTSF